MQKEAIGDTFYSQDMYRTNMLPNWVCQSAKQKIEKNEKLYQDAINAPFMAQDRHEAKPRQRLHPVLCAAVVEFMKSLMYVPSGAARPTYILQMTKGEAYKQFELNYIHILRKCANEIENTDHSSFAEKVSNALDDDDLTVRPSTALYHNEVARARRRIQTGLPLDHSGIVTIFKNGEATVAKNVYRKR